MRYQSCATSISVLEYLLITDLYLYLKVGTRMNDFQTDMNRHRAGLRGAQIHRARRRAPSTRWKIAFGGKTGRGRRCLVAAGAGQLAVLAEERGQTYGGGFEALSTKFASFVKANPGLRIEQINKDWGQRPRTSLCRSASLISGWHDQARARSESTTYFPGRKGK